MHSTRGAQCIIGVRWNNQSDQLIFDLSIVAQAALSIVPTKRTVISFIGRFFDPIGFLSPVTIRFKALMQEICKSQMSHLKEGHYRSGRV